MYKVKKMFTIPLLIFDTIGYVFFFWKKWKSFPKKPKSILVIRLDHIGDMVLTSSFFRNLKSNYPEAKITVLCRQLNKPIAESINHIDSIQIVNPPWFRGNGSLSSVLGWLRKNHKYDLVFDLHADPRNILLASLVGKYTIGFGIRGGGFLLNKLVTWKDNIHVVERQLYVLKEMGLQVDDGYLQLSTDVIAELSVEKILTKYKLDSEKTVLINPGSGSSHKDWPGFENLITLILKKTNFNIILIDKDNSRTRKLKNTNSRLVDFSGKLNIKQVIALTSKIPFFIGSDSMNGHIAAAFNKRIVSIFGSRNNKNEWKPYAKNVIVFQKNPINPYYTEKEAKKLINEIKAEDVLEGFIMLAKK